MHEVRAWKRAVRRWSIVDASRRRQATAVTLNLTPAVAAVTGFVVVRPASDWSDPLLLVALGAVAGIAYLAEARLRLGVLAFYGATFVVAVVALACAGPLPALVVWLVPDVLARFVLRREPRLSPGLVATVSSYALALLLGHALLALSGTLTGPESAPALYAAGLAMWAVNFCFARLTFAPYYQGIPPADLIRDEFRALAPAALGMLVVGVLAALAVEAYGLPALALLAAVVCVPQLVVERMVRSGPVSRLDRVEAARLYADAIADVLGISRQRRRELGAAAELAGPGPGAAGARDPHWRLADVSRGAFLALHSHERWAGDGWPAGLPADAIPLGSRILAVADAWAALTARDTAQLDQSAALLALEAQSGTAFDPAVVAAAARVVSDEAGFALEPAFAPKLHRLPGPRSWRRGALPSLLPGPAGT